MSKEIAIYYALQSPWTYLGWARLRELVGRTGAAAHYRPIQSGPMFEERYPAARQAPQAAPGVSADGAAALA